MAVAPDVEPVMTSFLAKEPAKVFSSATILSPASKPKAFVLSSKTKLFNTVHFSEVCVNRYGVQ